MVPKKQLFPYLFVGTFIEVFLLHSTGWVVLRFLAETFIEAPGFTPKPDKSAGISFLFGGGFIEAMKRLRCGSPLPISLSFWQGLH